MATHELGALTLSLMARKFGKDFLVDVADAVGGKEHALLKIRGGSTVGRAPTREKALRRTRLTSNKLHIWGASVELVRRCFNAVQLTISEYHSGVWGDRAEGEEAPGATQQEEEEEEELQEDEEFGLGSLSSGPFF